MGSAGIIMNPDKFVFCRNKVEYLGLELTEDGLQPSKETIRSITEFP